MQGRVKSIISLLGLILILIGNVWGDNWIGTAPLSCQREGLCAAVLSGEVYVMGGSAGPGVIYGVVEKYDRLTEQWLLVSPLNHPRTFAAAASAEGKIFVFGGRINSTTMEPTVEMFDPTAESWQDVATMNYPREGLSALAVNNQIWLIGGYSPTLSYTGMVEVFDPLTYDISMEQVPAISPARAGQGVAVIGGEVRILGGINYQILNNHTVWTDTNWVENPNSLPTPRFNLRGAIVGDSLLALGGSDLDGPVNLVECFSFSTNTWSVTEPMIYYRSGHAAAVVNDTVFAMGGFGGPSSRYGYLLSTEMLTPNVSKVQPHQNIVTQFSLNCYPNPFNSHLTIDLNNLNKPKKIDGVKLYNVFGETIFQWDAAEIYLKGGVLTWDGTTFRGVPAASGAYYVTALGDNYIISLPVILLR